MNDQSKDNIFGQNPAYRLVYTSKYRGQNMMGLVLLIFIVVFIFVKLYSTFGNNKYNDISSEETTKMKTAIEALLNTSGQSDTRNSLATVKQPQIVDPSLSNKILEVKDIFSSFVPEVFLKQAEQVFDTVFNAFANSQHQVLKSLLSEDLYENFAAQIKKRENKNLRQEINIEHQQTILNNIQILTQQIQLLVIFDIKQMTAMVDINGKSFDNPEKLYRNVRHKWVFETDVTSENWIITKTNSKEL